MPHAARKLFPYVVLLLAIAAMAWAVSFGTIPEADFTFINGTEVQSIDPARVTGQPEGRIIWSMFEGLYRPMPPKDDPTKLIPQPGMAESHTLSADSRTYTFTIRENAKWSNGSPVTAHDFAFSWQRFLHPETAGQYAGQLYYVTGAKRYNSGASAVKVGDRVEVELADRKIPHQLFPRGTMLAGLLEKVEKPPEPELAKDATEQEVEKADADWHARWIYHVNVKPGFGAEVDWNASGETKLFCNDPSQEQQKSKDAPVEKCMWVLVNFDEEVAIKATDDRTLVVTLDNPTSFFLNLVAFYPLYPVNRECVEKYGFPLWTKPENVVSNGPFNLEFRRIRDRIRLVKNPEYWDADNVSLEIVDALAVESYTTCLNMYLNGQVDWSYVLPDTVIPTMKNREDFHSEPILATYFYRFNVTRKPFDNVLVRRALNLAVNKQEIVDEVTKAGQLPARALVPPGLPVDYKNGFSGEYNVEKARELLAEAGYPDGKGFPKFEILYNTSESHGAIAEVIQRQWKKALGIDVVLKNKAWGVYLDDVHQLKHDIARAGWTGDYPDPNTFLDMFVTDHENNQTGWSNKEYDQLIEAAGKEPDVKKRLQMLTDAETIFMDEMPLIPIYFYVSKDLVKPYVKNFNSNIQDVHPLHIIRVDKEEKRRYLSEGQR